MLFVLIHLLGNLQLFLPDQGIGFNSYTEKLESFGKLLWIVEAGLVAIILFHAIIGISIAMEKRRARPEGYAVQKSGGAPSRMSASSKSMIWTGSVLLVFLVVHVATMKYGTYYETMIPGHDEPVRDLFRLVIETFQNPLWVAIYVGVMIMLGFHLRHGFWSALQSVGATRPQNSNLIYSIGLVFAILIALGFMVLPIYLYYAY
jgi:succinate dehydrogenase / fumarate reductase cytochrome b subunit